MLHEPDRLDEDKLREERHADNCEACQWVDEPEDQQLTEQEAHERWLGTAAADHLFEGRGE